MFTELDASATAHRTSFAIKPSEVEELLQLGGLAPSGGNVQPWRARVQDDEIDLFLDPVRSDSLIDVGRYASSMALGSFLENVIIGAQHLGLMHDVEIQNADDAQKLLVRISFTGRTDRPHESVLYPCIRTRCTNRRPHQGDPVSEQQVRDLRDAARSLGGEHTLSALGRASERSIAARILGRVDRVRMLNRALHEHMFSELRWTAEAAANPGDGMDTRSFELPAPAVGMLKLMRSYSTVRLMPRFMLEGLSRKLLTESSHLCVLSMVAKPSPSAFLDAGRALQRVWLTAERFGLAVQPWTVLPFLAIRAQHWNGAGLTETERDEILSLSEELAALFEVPPELCPFFIFRLSRAPAPSVRAHRLHWQSYTEIV
jgi:hypothetical protein